MRRIQEKIKDLVDVRPYHSLRNFILNPEVTLSAYHFTDATSEMMGKWLDSVLDIEGNKGVAKALAGYRGVGKSHFIATLGAILLKPELRGRISDSHVAAAIQRHERKNYAVAHVQRGSSTSLIDEFKNGIAKALNCSTENLSDSIEEILTFAANQSNNSAFIILIDTSQEREKRVMRDDGITLGEIAEIAKRLNIFVAIALDDDIAGADGANAAISKNFAIEYLDPEHLYRIVDTHIFPKQLQRQSILHEVYSNFREILPMFRWSEQRFSSVYPLHPIVADIAPSIRLYVPEFVILGFAAESGGKNVGRPANSLITLDEVFDRVEDSLRSSEFLGKMFGIYDKITNEIIGKIPIMQRLQAKMILKALAMLSLNGDGTSASEIAAAMLIYDENDAQKGVKTVELFLEEIATTYSDEVERKPDPNRETRFSLKLSDKNNLAAEIAKLAVNVDDNEVQKVLLRTAREIFSDWTFSNQTANQNFDSVNISFAWNGSIKNGKLIWKWNKSDTNTLHETSENSISDWQIVIKEPNADIFEEFAATENSPKIVWLPDALTSDELSEVKCYSVLLNDTNLSDNFGDEVRALAYSHSSIVKKIWKRAFIQFGKLFFDGQSKEFGEENQNFDSLAEMFSKMLEPVFETRFPNHPKFKNVLTMNLVSEIVSEIFSGKKSQSNHAKELAELFALPLGLVEQKNDEYVLADEPSIMENKWAKTIISAVSTDDVIPLNSIYGSLKQAPFGLSTEFQHLIVGALVAHNKLEFVTSTGDKIGKRSLDLQIIWDEIVGISRLKNVAKSSEMINSWAKIVTNLEIQSIEYDAQLIINYLTEWLNNWENERLFKRFNDLPDEVLNNKIWKLSTKLQKRFGVVVDAVSAIVKKPELMSDCFQSIADAFSNSPIEYLNCKKDLTELQLIVANAETYAEFSSYLALSEITEDQEIEDLRLRISEIGKSNNFHLQSNLSVLANEFKNQYSNYFITKHDEIMRSTEIRSQIDSILESNEWWEFENLSKIPVFHRQYWKKSQTLLLKASELNCNHKVRELLTGKPFCACQFQISNIDTWLELPNLLSETVNLGRNSYRSTLKMLAPSLIPFFESLVSTEKNDEFLESGKKINSIFSGNSEIPQLENIDLQVIKKIITALPNSIILQSELPEISSFATREELRAQFNQWFDTMPSEPILLKI